MITIQKSPTADTRTCDWANVTKEQLRKSSDMHIYDVQRGLKFWKDLLGDAGKNHDFDKLSELDHFHADFKTGFKETGWYKNHLKQNRHHLKPSDKSEPADINLVDVLEYITDCVMAGKARSGTVYDLEISSEKLMQAFKNTVSLLKEEVKVQDNI